MLGLGSGFGYALHSIFSRFSLNQGLSSITITNYTFLFAAIGGAFLTDFSVIAVEFSQYGLPLFGFLILYCIVTTVLPYLLYTTGLSYVENGPALVMASVEPVVAYAARVYRLRGKSNAFRHSWHGSGSGRVSPAEHPQEKG